MKAVAKIVCLLMLGIALTFASYARGSSTLWGSIKNPAIAIQLKSFVAEKEAQANAVTNEMPKEFKTFFVAAQKGDWLEVSNIFENLRDGSAPKNPDWHGTQWEAVREIWGAFSAFGLGNEKYSALFGNDIIESIPPGSIYFGGTDSGRFIVTAMQKSHVDAEPFFTLTQNAQADNTYLDYLRSMYGNKIYIPTLNDATACFQEYGEDGAKRLQNHQLEPGENISIDKNGRIEVSGQVAVIKITGLIAKVVFDKNNNREFYVDEDHPFEWMYPCLEPHGLILKLDHEPLAELSDQTIQQDRDYWTKTISPMIGSWVGDQTTVNDIAAFAEKVFLRHDFSGFVSDPGYVKNNYSHTMFSKARSSIGDLYAWRAKHARNPLERERMNNAADFALRQAWALCPYSPVAVSRYVNLLMEENRPSDALLVAETAVKFPSFGARFDPKQMQDLVVQLKQYLKAK